MSEVNWRRLTLGTAVVLAALAVGNCAAKVMPVTNPAPGVCEETECERGDYCQANPGRRTNCVSLPGGGCVTDACDSVPGNGLN